MPLKFIVVFGIISAIVSFSSPESSTCLTVYKEGGAPAVFQSPKCPGWTLSADGEHRRAANCQLAMLQGRRKYQEDRTFCALDMRIPFPGTVGVREMNVGVVAVFDGHNGAEASEIASKLLLEYFFLHIYFLLDGIYSVALKKLAEQSPNGVQQDYIFHLFNHYREIHQHKQDLQSQMSKLMFSSIFDETFHMEILKESLLRTVRDMDATFSKEAYKYNLASGSTATIVLIAKGHVLVANVGDSKALLCSKCFQSPQEVKGTLKNWDRRRRHSNAVYLEKKYRNPQSQDCEGSTCFCAKELTKDHSPDRDDERMRIEAAGGYVEEWAGVPRVNGELAVSRAIGDISFKSYGVISVPEVTDWQALTSNDSYLVAATDGVFEKMTIQDICDLLCDVEKQDHGRAESVCISGQHLADCIVNTAFERGSMDNIAAAVVPLISTYISGTSAAERCDSEGSIDSSTCRPQNLIKKRSDDAQSSSLISVEYANQFMENFKRLWVEGTNKKFGCFYLSENLNENMDYIFHAQNNDSNNRLNGITRALPCALDLLPSLFSDQNFCLLFGMDTEDAKGQCLYPEGFTSLLALLESIPFYDMGFNSSESPEYETLDNRYVVKRRFDRGSFGEVYLAFRWNCSQDGDTIGLNDKAKSCCINSLHLDPLGTTAEANSSQNRFADHDTDDLFVLKRIMIERGTSAYLSGLREKYFGEIFLNASLSFGGLLSERLLKSFPTEAQSELPDVFQMKKPVPNKAKSGWFSSYAFSSDLGMRKSDYEEGLMHIARYIESFESRSKEIWLVFRNEGLSLSKLMYSTKETKTMTGEEQNSQSKNVQVLHPSSWWHWLKTTDGGKVQMKNLVWQLLMALKSCHDRNITHRDIKPENMVVCFEDGESGRCLRVIPNGDKHYHTNMRIIDFGSAIDDFTIKHLYGSHGPSRSEQTYEYTPPEGLLNASWFQGSTSANLKYDMWSVGVVLLELILGSPHVFQISARTRALLDQHLKGWSESTKDLAYKLRSLMEMCILIPGSSPLHHDSGGRMKKHAKLWLASWKCSEEFFSYQVQQRDPLKIGFPNVWALRLVRQLLQWHPEDRISVDDALRHPYFQHPQA